MLLLFQKKNGNHLFGCRRGFIEFSAKGDLLNHDTIQRRIEVGVHIAYERLDNYVFVYTKRDYYISSKEQNTFKIISKKKDSLVYETELNRMSYISYYGTVINDSTHAIHTSSEILVISNDVVIKSFPLNEAIYGVFYFDETIWATTANGLYGLNPNETIESKKHYFEGITITSIYKSKDGVIWVTTNSKGIIKINPNTPKRIYKNEEESNISAIYADDKNTILGFNNGNVKINSSPPFQILEGSVSSFRVANGIPIAFGNGVPMELLKTKTGVLKKGKQFRFKNLQQLYGANQFIEFGPSLYLTSNSRRSAFFDTSGNFIQWANFNPSIAQIFKIEKIDGKIFVFCEDKLVVFKNLNDPNDFETLKSKKRIKSIVKFHNKTIGISEDGLVYNVLTGGAPIFQLPVNDDIYRYFGAVSKDEYLTLSTNNGVYTWLFNPATHVPKLVNFDPIKNVLFLTQNKDELYYATINSTFVRNYNSFNVILPEVRLSAINANNKEVDGTGPISLNHDFENLQFSLSNLSLQANFKNYRYRLKGYEKNFLYTKDKNIFYSSLNPGNYTFEYAGTTDGFNYSDIQSIEVRVAFPYWQKTWFLILTGLILITIIFTIYKLRVKRIRKQLLFKQTIAELKTQALTAQLNPHLVFNIMNSIQALVSTSQPERANIYISLFSKFMRSSLNMSKSQTVSIDDELILTEQYLSLEKLRFQNEIEFIIEEGSFDGKTFNIPPLTLQPLIENAIKHGVMPDINKKGIIKITCASDNMYDIIRISDNGIGTRKNFEFGNGLTITRNRLKTISQENELLYEPYTSQTTFSIKIKK